MSGAAHTPAYGEVDLTSCDGEPIHIPGGIQPHGVLLALDEQSRAVMASANVDGLLGIAAEDAVGRTLAELVGPTLAAAIGEGVEAAAPG
jgi:chemotaxis family two-component system sensor kinase Cph1